MQFSVSLESNRLVMSVTAAIQCLSITTDAGSHPMLSHVTGEELFHMVKECIKTAIQFSYVCRDVLLYAATLLQCKF